MQKKLHVKVGDTVKVISGTSKGSEGKVLRIDRSKDRVIVEGVNVVIDHVLHQVGIVLELRGNDNTNALIELVKEFIDTHNHL